MEFAFTEIILIIIAFACTTLFLFFLLCFYKVSIKFANSLLYISLTRCFNHLVILTAMIQLKFDVILWPQFD